MLNISALQAICPTVSFGFANAGNASKANDPRDVLAANIDDSIALLGNPNYTVARRGQAVKPQACFTVDATASIATIVLRYSHEALKLSQLGNTSIAVPVAGLGATLAAIKQQVLAGVFDAQLATIKQQRTAAQQAGLQQAAVVKQAQKAAAVQQDNQVAGKNAA